MLHVRWINCLDSVKIGADHGKCCGVKGCISTIHDISVFIEMKKSFGTLDFLLPFIRRHHLDFGAVNAFAMVFDLCGDCGTRFSAAFRKNRNVKQRIEQRGFSSASFSNYRDSSSWNLSRNRIKSRNDIITTPNLLWQFGLSETPLHRRKDRLEFLYPGVTMKFLDGGVGWEGKRTTKISTDGIRII